MSIKKLFGSTDKPKGYWKSPKTSSGHEFEEVIPVPKGVLPLKNILVGIFLNSDAAKNDPELANHPLRVGGR